MRLSIAFRRCWNVWCEWIHLVEDWYIIGRKHGIDRRSHVAHPWSGTSGSISVVVGSGTIGAGGRVVVSAGESTDISGGSVSLITGHGLKSSSGAFYHVDF